MATVAQVFIIGLAIIAALNQMGLAVTVILPVLITVLATMRGIAVVGVGGGLIAPMRQRWERWLETAEQEGQRIHEHNIPTNAPAATRTVHWETLGRTPRRRRAAAQLTQHGALMAS